MIGRRQREVLQLLSEHGQAVGTREAAEELGCSLGNVRSAVDGLLRRGWVARLPMVCKYSPTGTRWSWRITPDGALALVEIDEVSVDNERPRKDYVGRGGLDVLDTLEGESLPVTTRWMAEELGLSRKAAYRRLHTLCRAGLVELAEQTPRAWAISPEGLDALELGRSRGRV
jgi:DNA-binding IclR family transcriptional regulator